MICFLGRSASPGSSNWSLARGLVNLEPQSGGEGIGVASGLLLTIQTGQLSAAKIAHRRDDGGCRRRSRRLASTAAADAHRRVT